MAAPPRLFISADIEGIAGVVTPAQTLTEGREWADARRWMTQEVLAVIEAAREAGVQEFVVADSHLQGDNLLPDAFPDCVELVRSWPRPLGMMQGVDEGAYLGAVLLGYHTAAHHARGVLSHTLHGRMIHRLWLDQRPASETTLSMAIASHYGVPVLLASGDSDYCAYVAESYPLVIPVTVKVAYGRFSARSLSPARAALALAEGCRQALAGVADRAHEARPSEPSAVRVDVELKHAISAELLAFLPMVDRVDSYRVRWTSADIVAASRMLQFITQYQPVPG